MNISLKIPAMIKGLSFSCRSLGHQKKKIFPLPTQKSRTFSEKQQIQVLLLLLFFFFLMWNSDLIVCMLLEILLSAAKKVFLRAVIQIGLLRNSFLDFTKNQCSNFGSVFNFCLN